MSQVIDLMAAMDEATGHWEQKRLGRRSDDSFRMDEHPIWR
jgi:hypothetical protein